MVGIYNAVLPKCAAPSSIVGGLRNNSSGNRCRIFNVLTKISSIHKTRSVYMIYWIWHWVQPSGMLKLFAQRTKFVPGEERLVWSKLFMRDSVFLIDRQNYPIDQAVLVESPTTFSDWKFLCRLSYSTSLWHLTSGCLRLCIRFVCL